MKTYTQLREQQELQERRLLRTGSALVFGAKVREVGKRVESDISSAESKFNRAKQIDDINEKLNAFFLPPPDEKFGIPTPQKRQFFSCPPQS